MRKREPTPAQRAFTITGPTQKKVVLSRKVWNETEAIKPKSVKVKKCPGFTGASRYDPPQGFQGGFMDEWKKLRSKTGD